MVSFGDSKHETIKPLQSLLDVTPLKLALSAKCTIHDVCFRALLSSVLLCVWATILFDKFWFVCRLFVRLGNGYGFEDLAIIIFIIIILIVIIIIKLNLTLNNYFIQNII